MQKDQELHNKVDKIIKSQEEHDNLTMKLAINQGKISNLTWTIGIGFTLFLFFMGWLLTVNWDIVKIFYEHSH